MRHLSGDVFGPGGGSSGLPRREFGADGPPEMLVFGAREPKAGVVCSTCSMLDEPRYNHRVRWQEGVLAEESSARLQAFFQARR